MLKRFVARDSGTVLKIWSIFWTATQVTCVVLAENHHGDMRSFIRIRPSVRRPDNHFTVSIKLLTVFNYIVFLLLLKHLFVRCYKVKKTYVYIRI